MTDGQSIIVEYKNARPIELLDFTASLSALGDEFKHFVADAGGSEADARLFVREMRPGSVIAELYFWSQQIPAIADMAEHRDVLGGFVANWQEILQSILKLTPEARSLPKGTVKNARNFVEPIAKDGGSQVNLMTIGGGTINMNFNFGSSDAAAIAYNTAHLLANEMPEETRFQNEPMILWQVRDGPPARTGDMGRIDRFSEKAKKLTFGADDAKRTILDQDAQPFGLVYFVSGVVKRAGGKIVAYHILSVDSVMPREED